MSISSKPVVSEEDLRITRPRILRMENDAAETTNKYPGQLDTLRHLEGIVCHLLCTFFCVFAKAPPASPNSFMHDFFFVVLPVHWRNWSQWSPDTSFGRNRKNNLGHSRLDFVFESFVTMPLAWEKGKRSTLTKRQCILKIVQKTNVPIN